MNVRLLKCLTPIMLLALVSLAVLMPSISAAALPPTNSSPDFAAIDDYIEQEMREQRIPGLALGITQGNQVVHLKGFGMADPSGRAVTPQTPFLIFSSSKSFAALAIMQLVEAGRVALDAPVQRYLPWFQVTDPAASAQITVRQLLNHTSGLPESADVDNGSSCLVLNWESRYPW
jgi:CubicO group peptidase (beta-lactamase class C family)